MRPPEKTPCLSCLESLEGSQLVHDLIGQADDGACILWVRQSVGLERGEALDGQSAVVAKLDSLSESLAFAGVGLLRGDDLRLLLEGLLDLLGKISATLYGRGSDRRERAAGREGRRREKDGLEARCD